MAVVLGLGLCALVAIFPRFGPGSRQLILLILPASFSAGVQAFGLAATSLSEADLTRLSFALILLAAAGGYVACGALSRKRKQAYEILVGATAVVLVAVLYLAVPPYAEGMQAPKGYIPLGPAGYAAALYLLIVAVIVLANLEQILRSASETVRWN